jgi:3-dehydroquinate dehydratase-1
MSKISSEFPADPKVVATVHSVGALRCALKLPPRCVDVLELRLDCFAADPLPLLRALPKLKFPLLLTARHPAEGGAAALSVNERRALFSQFLPHASLIDVELRSVKSMELIIDRARDLGAGVVISNHHFHRTPAPEQLAELAARARASGADVFKLAAFASRPVDVASLLSLLSANHKMQVSVMGMGPLGKASRLLFARAGSVLNYGYLDKPNASGQWEARLLRKRVDELSLDV